MIEVLTFGLYYTCCFSEEIFSSIFLAIVWYGCILPLLGSFGDSYVPLQWYQYPIKQAVDHRLQRTHRDVTGMNGSSSGIIPDPSRSCWNAGHVHVLCCVALAEGLADGPSIHKQWVDSRRKDRDFSERIVGFYFMEYFHIFSLNIMVTCWYTLVYPLPMTIRVCCGKSMLLFWERIGKPSAYSHNGLLGRLGSPQTIHGSLFHGNIKKRAIFHCYSLPWYVKLLYTCIYQIPKWNSLATILLRYI